MMTRIIRTLARTISPVIDGEDVKILATVIVVVVVVGVALVVLAAFLGLALWTFDLARF